MQTPVRITLRHMDASPTLDALIHAQLAELEGLCESLIACNVLVEAVAHRNGRVSPALFDVKIDLTMPGHHVVVHGGRTQDEAHTNAYAAVRAAFDTVRRLIVEHLASRRSARRTASSVRAEE